MTTLSPFETQKNCRFIVFEIEGYLKGFQYISIRHLEWNSTQKKGQNDREEIRFLFEDSAVSVQGHALKRLIPFIQNDELSILRIGEISGDRPIRIEQIELQELSQ